MVAQRQRATSLVRHKIAQMPQASAPMASTSLMSSARVRSLTRIISSKRLPPQIQRHNSKWKQQSDRNFSVKKWFQTYKILWQTRVTSPPSSSLRYLQQGLMDLKVLLSPRMACSSPRISTLSSVQPQRQRKFNKHESWVKQFPIWQNSNNWMESNQRRNLNSNISNMSVDTLCRPSKLTNDSSMWPTRMPPGQPSQPLLSRPTRVSSARTMPT